MNRLLPLAACVLLAAPLSEACAQTQADTVVLEGRIEAVSVRATNPRSPVGSLTDGRMRLDMRQSTELPRFAGNVDPMRVLQLLPGVQTAAEGDSGFFVRGGDAGQSIVTLNGAPLYSYAHLFGFFSAFNPGHVVSFELDKTGCGGEGAASALSARSVETLAQTWGIKGDVGLISSQATLSAPLRRNVSLYLSARRSYAEWLVALILADDDELHYALQDYDATLVWQMGRRHKLIVNGHYGDDRVRTHFDRYIFGGRIGWHNSASSLRLESHFRPGLTAEHTLYWSDYTNRLDVSAAGTSVKAPSSIGEAGYKGAVKSDWGRMRLRAGLHYAFRTIDPLRVASDYTLAASPTQVPAPRFRTHEAAPFASLGIEATDRLEIALSLRYAVYLAHGGGSGGTYLSHGAQPAAQVAWRLSERTRLSVSYAYTVQYTGLVPVSNVSFSTDFWTAATASNPPVRSHNLSAGYYGTLCGGRLRLSAEVYWRRMHDVLEYDLPLMSMIHAATRITDHIRSGEGEACGLELTAVYGSPRLSCWAGYTLARSVRRFDELNGGEPFPAKQDRRHDLSLVATWHASPRWDVGAVFVYASGGAYTSPTDFYIAGGSFVRGHGSYNGSRLPAYHRLDLSVTRWFGRKGDRSNGLNLSLYNVYAHKNPLYVSWPIHYNDDMQALRASRRKHYIHTIIPSVSWIFKF